MIIKPPSTSFIRSELIVEKINSLSDKLSQETIKLIFTGKTGAGKTTLSNRLIGIEGFLKSTGHQDCTDEVNIIRFNNNSLVLVDLPGIASEDKLENYNRGSLGINQVEDFPQVEQVTLANYSKDFPVQKETYNLSQSNQPILSNSDDLVLYIVAPHTLFLRDESRYHRDLLSRHQRVIYILNMFVDKDSQTCYSTPENISDAINRITENHQAVLGEHNQPTIVKMNCFSVEGLDKLLAKCVEKLGETKGLFLKEAISYQIAKTPKVYLGKIKGEILKSLAYIACQKPDSGKNVLVEAAQNLWHLLLGLETQYQPSFPQELIQSQSAIVISQCTIRHYEDVVKEITEPIYKPEPVYRTEYYEVVDPNSPIYTTVRYTFLGMVYDTKRYISGYNNKWESREVFSHWEQVYSHTERRLKPTGEKRLVGTTYNHFQLDGIVFLLSLCYLFLQEVQRDQVFESYQKQFKEKLGKLSLPTKLTPESILPLLKRESGNIFDSSFEQLFLNRFK